MRAIINKKDNYSEENINYFVLGMYSFPELCVLDPLLVDSLEYYNLYNYHVAKQATFIKALLHHSS